MNLNYVHFILIISIFYLINLISILAIVTFLTLLKVFQFKKLFKIFILTNYFNTLSIYSFVYNRDDFHDILLLNAKMINFNSNFIFNYDHFVT